MDYSIIIDDDTKIKDYINKNNITKYSVMNIDFDNITKINEVYSYIFGTALLEEGFNIIKNNIDGRGRVIMKKSDEILVLMVDMDENETLSIGYDICEEVAKLYAGDQEQIKFTVSIGVAMSVENNCNIDYMTVLKNSEIVLQFIKKTTKNRALCFSYLDANNVEIQKDEIRKEIKNSKSKIIKRDRNLNLFCMDLLERTRDFKSAIKLLLMKVGKFYGFDRISVINFNVPKHLYSELYVWDKNQIYMDQENVEYPYEEELYNQYIEEIEKEGIVCLDDSKYNNLFQNTSNAAIRVQVPYYFRSIIQGIVSYETKNTKLNLLEADLNNIKQFSKNISLHITGRSLDSNCQDKSIFLSRVTHDLRTPVSNIIGLSGLIKESVKERMEQEKSYHDNLYQENLYQEKTLLQRSMIVRSLRNNNEKLTEYAEKLDILSQYIFSLVSGILDVSKIENGRFNLDYTYFNLEDLCNEIINMNLVNAKKERVVIDYYFDRLNKKIRGDMLRIREVLMNLITNSIKYSKNRGKTILSTEILKLEKSKRKVTIRFAVKDNGIGISDENKEKIFAPFDRTGSENAVTMADGYGVGLYICRNIVQAMGGELSVDSEEGYGSVFYFDLQFDYKDNDDCMKKNLSSLDHYFTGKKVLLVDDNDINIIVEKHMLEKNGFDVDVARDGFDAIEKYCTSSEDYYDIILMDIRMPVMNGSNAINEIRNSKRKDSNNVKIIAVTANQLSELDPDIEADLVPEYIDGYLTKPLKIEDIIDVLSKIY